MYFESLRHMIFKWNLVFVTHFIEYYYFTLREILGRYAQVLKSNGFYSRRNKFPKKFINVIKLVIFCQSANKLGIHKAGYSSQRPKFCQ